MRDADPAAFRLVRLPVTTVATYAAMLAGLLAAYLPAVVVPYAFSDDWEEFAGAHGFGQSPWHSWAEEGRVVNGAFSQAALSAAQTIDDLRLVRLIGVIGIAALVLLLRRALMRIGVGGFVAAMMALFVATLPPFQVYAAWTILFMAPWAAVLAGAASLVIAGANGTSRRPSAARLAGASALFLAAILTYQPTAMFFWVFLAIALFRPGQERTRTLRLLWSHLFVAAVSLAAGFAVFKVGLHFYPRADTARTSLTTHPIAKVDWFVTKPLYRSINLVALRPTLALAVLVTVTIVVGLLLLYRRSDTSTFVLVTIAACLIPLAYLPNLVIRESWGANRTQGALNGILGIYFILGALGIARALKNGRAAVRVGALACAALAAVSVLLAARNVTTLFVKPQSAELRVIRGSIPADLGNGVARLTFIRAHWYDSAAPVVYCDEYGLPSSETYWAPAPAVYLVLRDEGRLPKTFEGHVRGLVSRVNIRSGSTEKLIVDVLPATVSSTSSNGAVIDMRKLRSIADGWSFWTLQMQPLHEKPTSGPAAAGFSC
jgi:hypothetical protein